MILSVVFWIKALFSVAFSTQCKRAIYSSGGSNHQPFSGIISSVDKNPDSMGFKKPFHQHCSCWNRYPGRCRHRLQDPPPYHNDGSTKRVASRKIDKNVV